MIAYLLDTNVVSEMRKSPRKADRNFVRWAHGLEASRCFVSAVSILELERGVLLKERSDAEQGASLRKWLDGEVIPTFGKNILPVTVPVAKKAASFHVPNPAPYNDALIGATALNGGYTLVTRNTKDFERFGVACINPWETGVTR